MIKTLDYIFPKPPADLDPTLLDFDKIPVHVAIIMDGNGRWAKSRGKQRLAGHTAGIESLREIIRASSDVGVKYLTIYSFSSENWNRPKNEVSGLMDLFAKTMLAELEGLDDEHVRVKTIGLIDSLPSKTKKAFLQAEDTTASNDGMTLVIAVNYGSRQELVDATKKLITKVCDKTLSVDEINEEAFANNLYTAGIPDPDLVIRTSGELRISNFLLWQIAYSEFYYTDILWPDFDRYEFLRALLDYQDRERRFGVVKK